MKLRRLAVAGATITTGALILSGCSAPQQESEVISGTEIRVAWNDTFREYNNATATGNATANTNIIYLANSSFNYYNDVPELVRNEDFGTYEQVSEDPLTIEYTVNEDVTWSDGTPVDAADMLLAWGANTTHLNSVTEDEVTADEETGEITDQAGGVYFNSGATEGLGLDLVSETPEISDDGRTLTFVYDEPYVDWEVATGTLTGTTPGVSAHGTVQLAFPEEDYSGEEAKEVLIEAIQNEDAAVLGPVSESWNNDYRFSDMPEEPQKVLSNGAYTITDMVSEQYVELTANPDYTWGPKPAYETITVRVIEDPQAQIQALENGEVDIVAGQPTADLLQQVEALDGIQFEGQAEGTYEHVDVQVTNGGPFDPAVYGGDEATAALVREAFFKTVPRQEILDKLIIPLQDNAELRNSVVFVPGSENYEASIAENGFPEYEVDIEGATALLAEAGVPSVDVRVLFAEGNPRRQQEFELMRQSASQAGFNLIDASSATWGVDLSTQPNAYDAALFGWQSTSLAVGESGPNYQTGGINNYYGWSNEEIDTLFTELQTQTDPAEQLETLIEAETLIADQYWTVPIFQFPGLTAWSDQVTGVSPAILSPTYFWNFWEWAPTEGAEGE